MAYCLASLLPASPQQRYRTTQHAFTTAISPQQVFNSPHRSGLVLQERLNSHYMPSISQLLSIVPCISASRLGVRRAQRLSNEITPKPRVRIWIMISLPLEIKGTCCTCTCFPPPTGDDEMVRGHQFTLHTELHPINTLCDTCLRIIWGFIQQKCHGQH